MQSFTSTGENKLMSIDQIYWEQKLQMEHGIACDIKSL